LEIQGRASLSQILSDKCICTNTQTYVHTYICSRHAKTQEHDSPLIVFCHILLYLLAPPGCASVSIYLSSPPPPQLSLPLSLSFSPSSLCVSLSLHLSLSLVRMSRWSQLRDLELRFTRYSIVSEEVRSIAVRVTRHGGVT